MSVAVKAWVGLVLLLLGVYGGYTAWRLYDNRQHLSGVGAPEPDAGSYSDIKWTSPGDVKPLSPEAQRLLDKAHGDTSSSADGSPSNKPVDLWAVSLTERSGERFAFKDLQGKVWITSFFFSSCPGPCRQINIAIAGLQKELADKDVKFVSITVDPENDTAPALAAYAKGFEADPQRWLFLTGEFDTIRDVCTSVFEMPIDKKVHTERLTLVDRAGKPRGTYNTADAIQMHAMKKKIDELLAEPAAEKPAANIQAATE